MESRNIFAVVGALERTSGTNDKVALLREFMEDPDFRLVLRLTYDPMTTYGVTVSEKYPAGTMEWDLKTIGLLEHLADRSLTGNLAKDAIAFEFMRLEPFSQELLRRVINRDLKVGINAKLINRAVKGTIAITPYMRCSLPKDVNLSTWPWTTGVISQIKADGMFANISKIYNKAPIIQSRKGQLYDSFKFKQLLDETYKYMFNGFQYHGELLVKRDGIILPRKTGNGILNRVLKGGDFLDNEEPIYHAWDAVPLEYANTGTRYDESYDHRLGRLHSSLGIYENAAITLIETRIVHSLEEAIDHYNSARERGYEGTIIKKPSAIWRDGDSLEQVKMKAEKEADLEVLGMNPGTGKNEDTFGSLRCVTSDRGLEVNVSGFTDDDRREIYDNFEAEWKHHIISVKFNEVIKSKTSDLYSLFLPRFDEKRTDKHEADSTLRVLNL